MMYVVIRMYGFDKIVRGEQSDDTYMPIIMYAVRIRATGAMFVVKNGKEGLLEIIGGKSLNSDELKMEIDRQDSEISLRRRSMGIACGRIQSQVDSL